MSINIARLLERLEEYCEKDYLSIRISPKTCETMFLVLIDLFAFPVILWLCYAIRLFDLGAEVIPGINYGVAFVTILAALSLMLTGVYRFIVRTFNEAFIAKLAIAVTLMVIVLYGMNAFRLHLFRLQFH